MAAIERCIHGKRIPHVHAGGTCLFSPWLTRPVHCPKCAAEGRPAIPAKPCKHMRAAVKAAQEQGEQLCKRECGRPVANKKDFYDYWREGVCEKCGCDDLIDRDARAERRQLREDRSREARLFPPLGPSEVEAAILGVMERARWDQDTLDAVLRALELPFAARRLRLRVQPLYETTIAPTGRRGRAKRATKANSPRKVTRS